MLRAKKASDIANAFVDDGDDISPTIDEFVWLCQGVTKGMMTDRVDSGHQKSSVLALGNSVMSFDSPRIIISPLKNVHRQGDHSAFALPCHETTTTGGWWQEPSTRMRPHDDTRYPKRALRQLRPIERYENFFVPDGQRDPVPSSVPCVGAQILVGQKGTPGPPELIVVRCGVIDPPFGNPLEHVR